MNHVVGSAIKILVELTSTDGLTASVTLTDPDGTVILDDTAMTATTSPSIGFVKFWQSLLATHSIGKYIALVKVVNGEYTTCGKHHFYLESQS